MAFNIAVVAVRSLVVDVQGLRKQEAKSLKAKQAIWQAAISCLVEFGYAENVDQSGRGARIAARSTADAERNCTTDVAPGCASHGRG
jgi:hypothetical protein